ncbi:MAG TPA: zinc-binding dehydrogenase, partial [Polyangiaceae bacterium]|nr:zinc-binding dehydrogenase [Polyangiaceae bacterium]
VLRFRHDSLDTERLASGSIAARTLFTAISPGTELAAYRGDPPLRPGPVYPRLVGYCNVAEILAVGSGVDGLAPGERILTFQSHRSAFVCDAREVVAKVPARVESRPAAVTYLFQLGYNAILKGGLLPGHHLGVLGLGTLGLATVALGARFGADVHAFSDQEGLRSAALGLGAQHAWAKDVAAAEIARASGGFGLDLVVTTSNSWADWRLALELPRKEGTIAVLGFPGRAEGPPPFNPIASEFFYDRQLRLVAAGQSPEIDAMPHEVRFTVKRNCAFLLDLIARNALAAERLIGFEAPYRDLVAAYEALDARSGRPGTGVLRWT